MISPTIPILTIPQSDAFTAWFNANHLAGDMMLVLADFQYPRIPSIQGQYGIGFMSWAQAQSEINALPGVPFCLAYDLEHWDKTPANERANPLSTIATASADCHGHGLEFFLVPDAQFNRSFVVNGSNHAAQYADKYLIQAQHQEQRGVAAFVAWWESMVGPIKAANPSCDVWVQVLIGSAASPSLAVACLNAMVTQPAGVSLFADVFTDGNLPALAFLETTYSMIRNSTTPGDFSTTANGPVLRS